MKLTLIILLVVLAVVSGLFFSSLQRELLSARNSAALYEKRSDDLQRELMSVNDAYKEKERVLNEIEQSITELERRVDLRKLERYLPKETWNEIKPFIDSLKAFQGAGENNNLSRD